MKASGTQWWHVHAETTITLLSSAEGGRTQPIRREYGYRPNHQLADGLFCMGPFLSIEGGNLRPGETANVGIVFLVVAELVHYFEEGFAWNIHEGATRVGTGRILSIVRREPAPA